MKKYTLIILGVLISGCGKVDNIYSDYEHYNLDNKYSTIHTSINENGQNDTYLIADIPGLSSEGSEIGLFYQVDKNDYILLENLEVCDGDTINKDNSYFYTDDKINKLYVMSCMSAKNVEYSLEKEKIIKKELPFNREKINSKNFNVIFNRIEEVNSSEIYFTGIDLDNRGYDLNIICSLSDYECDIDIK